MVPNLAFNSLELTDEGLPYSLAIKSIRDPIHGYITVGVNELPIVDSPFLQRLRRVKQLQTAYLVYPGAEHSRFQHSLGVMHLTGKFALSLIRNTIANKGKRVDSYYFIPKLYNLEIDDTQELISHLLAVRIAGLIHDIGHGPYSHAFDDAIISKSNELNKRGVYSHEDLGFYILKNYLINEIEKAIRYRKTMLNEQILYDCLYYILSPRREKEKYKVTSLCKSLRYVLREFIYPADILDFTIRDSYYSGAKEFGMVDANRLMMFSVILLSETNEATQKETLIAPFDNALNTLRAFLYSRFWLFNNVYFHKISRVFDYVVKNTLKELNKCANLEEPLLNMLDGNPSDFLMLDDLYILHKAKECGGAAWEWGKKIVNRDIPFKEIYKGELHLPRHAKKDIALEDLKPPEHPEKIANELKSFISEEIGVSDTDLIIDYPHLRFFPDNPYLPDRTFLLLERRGEDSLSVRNLTVGDILFGSIIDVTVLRVFISKTAFSSIDNSRLRHLRDELRESEIIEKFTRSLLYHWGRSELGVTM